MCSPSGKTITAVFRHLHAQKEGVAVYTGLGKWALA